MKRQYYDSLRSLLPQGGLSRNIFHPIMERLPPTDIFWWLALFCHSGPSFHEEKPSIAWELLEL